MLSFVLLFVFRTNNFAYVARYEIMSVFSYQTTIARVGKCDKILVFLLCWFTTQPVRKKRVRFCHRRIVGTSALVFKHVTLDI